MSLVLSILALVTAILLPIALYRYLKATGGLNPFPAAAPMG